MMFTPKGLSVRLRHRSICSFTYWALAFMAEMIPRPPPLETAAASLPSEIQAMPPWKMGYSMPKRSHKGVFIMVGPPFYIIPFLSIWDGRSRALVSGLPPAHHAGRAGKPSPKGGEHHIVPGLQQPLAVGLVQQNGLAGRGGVPAALDVDEELLRGRSPAAAAWPR